MFEEQLSNEKLNKILLAFREELSNILKERLNNIFLFGSQARGDARPGSDIDVLIVINGNFDYSQIQDLTSLPTWKLSLENDVVISRVFTSKEQFDTADSPFLTNVHHEAILV